MREKKTFNGGKRTYIHEEHRGKPPNTITTIPEQTRPSHIAATDR